MDDHNATVETLATKLKQCELPVTLFVAGAKPAEKAFAALCKSSNVTAKVDAVTEYGAQITFKAA